MGVFFVTRKLMDMAWMPVGLHRHEVLVVANLDLGPLPAGTPSIMPWLGP